MKLGIEFITIMKGESMQIPPTTDSRWKEFVTGKIKPDFECFALKILLGRLNIPITDSEKIPGSIAEIHSFFEKNPNLPSAIKDLEKIFH
jgi:hypothetical protein